MASSPDQRQQWPMQIPEQWPSAWPSLARRALVGAALPLTAAVVALVVIVVMRVAATAWWVPLLPALLAIWPLTLPARVRSAIQRASDAKALLITVATAGLLVRTPSKAAGIRPSAEIPAVGRIRYYAN